MGSGQPHPDRLRRGQLLAVHTLVPTVSSTQLHSMGREYEDTWEVIEHEPPNRQTIECPRVHSLPPWRTSLVRKTAGPAWSSPSRADRREFAETCVAEYIHDAHAAR